MKTLVVYCSQSGSTKAYSEEIANEFGATLLPIRKFNGRLAKQYETIVFGGWVNNGQIQGLDRFLSDWEYFSDKNVFVFSSGVTIPTKESRENLISSNLLNMYHLRFYQLRGSFDISTMRFPYSFIIKVLIKSIERDPNASPEQKAFVNLKNSPLHYYDHEAVEKICKVMHSIENIVEVKTKDK